MQRVSNLERNKRGTHLEGNSNVVQRTEATDTHRAGQRLTSGLAFLHDFLNNKPVNLEDLFEMAVHKEPSWHPRAHPSSQYYPSIVWEDDGRSRLRVAHCNFSILDLQSQTNSKQTGCLKKVESHQRRLVNGLELQ